MEVTVIHKSDLCDYLYDFYYLNNHNNILPGSLLELSEANKFEFVSKKEDSQSTKDYYHSKLEEQINQTNFKVVRHLITLATQELKNSGNRYWFIERQAWQFILDAEKLIIQLYQNYNFNESDNLTDEQYEELVEEVTEYHEVIQDKVTKAYELAVPTYIAKYNAMFGETVSLT